MPCMKCGRDVESNQVFCDSCREIMAKYPVKPGTVVQLPRRRTEFPVKKAPARRRPPMALEEQVQLLRKQSRRLALALMVTLLLLAGLAYWTLDSYFDRQGKPLPGQNYSSVDSATATTEGK